MDRNCYLLQDLESSQSVIDDVTGDDDEPPPPPLPTTSPPKPLNIQPRSQPPVKAERKDSNKSATSQAPANASHHTPVVDRTAMNRASVTSESTTSPDIWDQSPNSPPFKSFSEKMAWAKNLEQGVAGHQAPAASRDKKKPRPPLTSQSEKPVKKPRGRPSDIEEGLLKDKL